MALRRNQDTPCWVGVLDGEVVAVEEGEDGYHFEDTVVVVREGFVLSELSVSEEGLGWRD